MFGWQFDENRNQDYADPVAKKFQVNDNKHTDICPIFINCFSIKSYGEAPERMVSDPMALVGSNTVNIEVSRRL